MKQAKELRKPEQPVHEVAFHEDAFVQWLNTRPELKEFEPYLRAGWVACERDRICRNVQLYTIGGRDSITLTT